MNELKIYTCIQYKREYQSDEERRPYCFKKDGSPFRCFNATEFCSKDCYLKQRKEKFHKTLMKHPEIEVQRRQNISNFYKTHEDKLKEFPLF